MNDVHRPKSFKLQEGHGRLRFSANEPLVECLQAFRNQSTRASLGRRGLLLYSDGKLGYRTGIDADEQSALSDEHLNYLSMNQANMDILRRQDTHLSLQNRREYKRLPHDNGLNIRLNIVVDELTRRAIGSIGEHFIDNDAPPIYIVPAHFHVPYDRLQTGHKLLEARDRLDESLAITGHGALTVKPRGIEFSNHH